MNSFRIAGSYCPMFIVHGVVVVGDVARKALCPVSVIFSVVWIGRRIAMCVVCIVIVAVVTATTFT